MKKLSSLLLFFLFSMALVAENVWTVKSVPNTRLQGMDFHVSDPDGYLSDSAEMTINTALCAIRDKADVFVVTLRSIGDAESKRFATQLFNYWGIGDAETNNGVLLLFVEDQHALEFETGYGAEETLTDAKCERIFTKAIVPFFKAGDYEGGLCSGVAEIVVAFDGEVPVGLKTTLPSGYGDDGEIAGIKDEDMSGFFLSFLLFMFVMPIMGLVQWFRKREKKSKVIDNYQLKTEDNATYIKGFKTNWTGSPWEGKGCLSAIMIGLSIVVIFFITYIVVGAKYPDMAEKSRNNWVAVITLLLYLTWICYRQNHRALKMADAMAKKTIMPKEAYKAAFKHEGNKIAMGLAPWLGVYYYLTFKKRIENVPDYCCPTCGHAMKKDAAFHLPEIHELEKELEALRFEPYRCAYGHVFVVQEKGKHFVDFTTCEKCGAFTMKKIKTETLNKADYSHEGEKVETYVCQHCGETFTKTMVIPKLVHYSSGGSSSSSSGKKYSSSSSHSSHSSGGSFGGGSSGGGGYSGKW